MKTLSQQLIMYAKYHRDPRNIVTHFIGIPMIVFAVAVLLSRAAFDVAGVSISLAHIVVACMGVYYLVLNLKLGVLMVALLGACIVGADKFAVMEFTQWLSWGVGLFIVGWVFQFVGHFYEGKKPAFVDDLSGLAIGPLFVVCEFLFMCGTFKALKAAVEADAGPVTRQTGVAAGS